jgi:hypothetical protein
MAMNNYHARLIKLELSELNNAARLTQLKKQAKLNSDKVRQYLLNREYHIEEHLMNKNSNSLTKAANALNSARNSRNRSIKAAKNASLIAQKLKTSTAGKLAAKAHVYSMRAKLHWNKAFNTYPNVVKRRGRFVAV